MTELEYRTIPPEDHQRFARICAVAYNVSASHIAEGLAGDDGQLARGVYRGARLVSGGLLIPLRVMAGGPELACGGIGMVATPPEERRRGYTAALLRGMVGELRAQQTPISTLGAFKNSFYGRYGWATYLETRRLSGPPALFASFRARPSGAWEPCGPEAIPEVDGIYRRALQARFGPMLRDAAWWDKRVLRGRDGGYQHLYVWRDDAGTARAYVVFRFEDQPAGRVLSCREAVAADPQARAQIFGLFANHEDQSAEVAFSAPSDAPVQLLLPDPLEARMEPGYMLRLLDVDAALAALRYSGDAQGRLTLRVADDWLPHNHGVFELEVAGGRAEVRRLPDGAEADLALDVRQLAQVCSRHLRPRTAAAFGLLEVHSRPALGLLDRLFSGPAPFTSDWF